VIWFSIAFHYRAKEKIKSDHGFHGSTRIRLKQLRIGKSDGTTNRAVLDKLQVLCAKFLSV